MNSQLWFDGIGWVGAVALLIAYALVSSKRLEGDSAALWLLSVHFCESDLGRDSRFFNRNEKASSFSLDR